MRPCPVCLKPATIEPIKAGVRKVSCKWCGKYRVSAELERGVDLDNEKRYILSGIVRIRFEQKIPTDISPENVQDLLDSMAVPSDLYGKIDWLLEYLRWKASKDDQYIRLNLAFDYPILFAKDTDEFSFYLQKALEGKYIEQAGDGYRPDTEGWRRLAELDKVAEQEADVEISPEILGETERVWDGIRGEIEASSLGEDFKEIALYDLEQAKLAYRSGAFKACIVMLGAVLEGLMLGTIRRREVLRRIKTDPPKVVKSLGLQDPRLADKMAGELGFEDLATYHFQE